MSGFMHAYHHVKVLVPPAGPSNQDTYPPSPFEPSISTDVPSNREKVVVCGCGVGVGSAALTRQGS